jgi:hypothetical protein
MSWAVLKDPWQPKAAKGWLRVTVHEGKAFVKNLGQGWGTRDFVFVLALLEVRRDKEARERERGGGGMCEREKEGYAGQRVFQS